MVSTTGTPVTQDTKLLNGKMYTDKIQFFSMGCVLFYLLYKKYPSETSENKMFKWDIADFINEKKIVFNENHLKQTNDDGSPNPYYEIVKTIQLLLYYEENKLTWYQFENNTFIKECRKVSEDLFKKGNDTDDTDESEQSEESDNENQLNKLNFLLH